MKSSDQRKSGTKKKPKGKDVGKADEQMGDGVHDPDTKSVVESGSTRWRSTQ